MGKKNKGEIVWELFTSPDRPETVTIGPFVYDISFDRVNLLEAQNAEREILWGHSEHAGLNIVVAEGQAPALQRETLLHEILHSIVHQYAISWGMDAEREEHLVRQLSPALFAFLVDNPEVVQWLQS